MDDLLKRLIDARHSASSAAREMRRQLQVSLSREACIGRAWRLGWHFNSEAKMRSFKPLAVPRMKAERRPPREKVRRAPLPKIIHISAPVEPQARGKYEDIAPERCRWIHGDVQAGGWRCCSAMVHTGSPYCVHHAIRTHRPDIYRGRVAL